MTVPPYKCYVNVHVYIQVCFSPLFRNFGKVKFKYKYQLNTFYNVIVTPSVIQKTVLFVACDPFAFLYAMLV